VRATAIEFRLRMAILVAIIALGFWSPWIEAWGVGQRMSLMEWLALEASRLGLLSFALATPAAIIAAALLAAAGVVLRVWGAAYLGTGVVHNREMKAGAVMADGPYRFVRNPLCLGTWFMVAAMSFIMPAGGALFVMVLLMLFLVRLILGEEAFLSAQLGEPYRAYLRAVPRLLPRLRSSLPQGGRLPHWGQALIAEVNPIGVFFVIAILSWNYDSRLMTRAILIVFGVSLIVRAIVPGASRETDVAA
jgi:protein-S-isoprenylcysteine O-methyltransferase Ste14